MGYVSAKGSSDGSGVLVTQASPAMQPAMATETQDPKNKTRYTSSILMFVKSNMTNYYVVILCCRFRYQNHQSLT